MNTMKLHEQLTFLRKQKGITQEELAKALGVSNQAVSKWESGQCCPDIQLVPSLADFFEVSIDELLDRKHSNTLGEICLSIKDYFTALPEKVSFEHAYRLAALLHEITVTDGYKKHIPWQKKDYSIDNISSWGLSVSSEAEGIAGRTWKTLLPVGRFLPPHTGIVDIFVDINFYYLLIFLLSVNLPADELA